MTKTHWEHVYETKAPDAVSWYAPHLDESLRYILRTSVGLDARIVDVGGGEATLVDDLLDAGYQHVSVLDLSSRALEVSQSRLGTRSAKVTWLVADVLSRTRGNGRRTSPKSCEP